MGEHWKVEMSQFSLCNSIGISGLHGTYYYTCIIMAFHTQEPFVQWRAEGGECGSSVSVKPHAIGGSTEAVLLLLVNNTGLVCTLWVSGFFCFFVYCLSARGKQAERVHREVGDSLAMKCAPQSIK